jgi:hypothetical protein
LSTVVLGPASEDLSDAITQASAAQAGLPVRVAGGEADEGLKEGGKEGRKEGRKGGE